MYVCIEAHTRENQLIGISLHDSLDRLHTYTITHRHLSDNEKCRRIETMRFCWKSERHINIRSNKSWYCTTSCWVTLHNTVRLLENAKMYAKCTEKPKFTQINYTLVDFLRVYCVVTSRITTTESDWSRSTPATVVRQLNGSQMISLICSRLPAHSWLFGKEKFFSSVVNAKCCVRTYLPTKNRRHLNCRETTATATAYAKLIFFVLFVSHELHQTGLSMCVCIIYTRICVHLNYYVFKCGLPSMSMTMVNLPLPYTQTHVFRRLYMYFEFKCVDGVPSTYWSLATDDHH